MSAFFTDYFRCVAEIAHLIDVVQIERLVDELVALRDRGGRLFFLGIGGSAANCTHAVNDFRKLCEIDAYTPVDNVAELTARANDEGWSTIFSGWLVTSRADDGDAVFVLSVGGGDEEHHVSPNIVSALREAQRRHMKIFGIVGRQEGYTQRTGDLVVIVPTVNERLTTPLAEAFQAVIWHCLVSHPKLQRRATKWEGMLQGLAT